jgi:hypothetical protein
MFENLTKAVVGVVVSPVSIAADVVTCFGLATDRDEPYTVSSMRSVLKNLENAVNPDELSDDQIRRIIREVEKRK